jgi:hypothetical protein
LKVLELRFVLKMGTSFLDYQSAKAEKQAEEHDEPRSQRYVLQHSCGSSDRPRATHWAPKTKAPPRAGMEGFLNGTIIVTFMRELLKCMGEFLSKPMWTKYDFSTEIEVVHLSVL